jgi:hypothetical protein
MTRPTISTAVPQEGTRAYPIVEGFERLGIRCGKGYQLMKTGELKTFTIGVRRYITEEALQRFVRQQIKKSLSESHETRAAKVARAVAGRARRREAR